MNRKLIVGAGLMAAALALTACTGGDAPPAGATGANLRVGVTADIVTTLPTLFQQNNTEIIMSQMYDTIVTEGDVGIEVKPSLAESWEISADGLLYTLTLRDGVTFHDGSELDSEDVVWSFEHAQNSEISAAIFKNVAAVEALDARTVLLTLSTLQADLLFELASPQASILPVDLGGLSEDEFIRTPIGSGPFKWDGRTEGAEIRFAANPDYWGGAPNAATLTFIVFGDPNAQVLALQAGEIDIAAYVSLETIGLFEAVGTVVPSSVMEGLEYMTTNANSPVAALQEPAFRRAVSMAIDRDSIAQALYSGYGEGAQTLLSQVTFPSGVPQLTDSPYAYDPAKAKALLAETSYAGEPMRFIYSTGRPIDAQITQAIQANLREIGVTVELVPMESNAWLGQVTTVPNDSFEFSMSSLGGRTATGQLQSLARTFWMGGGWTDPMAADAAAAYAAAGTSPQQQAVLTDFEQQLSESMITFGLTYYAFAWVAGPGVEGLESPPSMFFDLTSVTVSG